MVRGRTHPVRRIYVRARIQTYRVLTHIMHNCAISLFPEAKVRTETYFAGAALVRDLQVAGTIKHVHHDGGDIIHVEMRTGEHAWIHLIESSIPLAEVVGTLAANRENTVLRIVARLKPGVSIEQARGYAMLGSLVDDLNEINEAYRLAARREAPDGDGLFLLDTRFHRTYVEAGAGPRLRGLHDAIKPQIERYVRIYQTVLTDAIRTSVVEHAAIIAEIATGSGRGAQEAVRTNWRNAAARLRELIASRGEAGSW